MEPINFFNPYSTLSINVPGTEQYFATPPSLNMPMASMVPGMIAETYPITLYSVKLRMNGEPAIGKFTSFAVFFRKYGLLHGLQKSCRKFIFSPVCMDSMDSL